MQYQKRVLGIYFYSNAKWNFSLFIWVSLLFLMFWSHEMKAKELKYFNSPHTHTHTHTHTHIIIWFHLYSYFLRVFKHLLIVPIYLLHTINVWRCLSIYNYNFLHDMCFSAKKHRDGGRGKGAVIDTLAPHGDKQICRHLTRHHTITNPFSRHMA